MITRQMPTSGRSGNVSPWHSVRMTVSNTHRGVLEWLQSTCGGILPDKSYVGGNGGHRPVWEWRIKGHAALDFLQEVRPYLKIKAPQAWLALESAAQKASFARTGMGVRISTEELALREGYRLAMKNLNAGTAGI